MTKITSAIAAAFIASASFASVALADEGQYYQGTAQASASGMIDTMSTASVGQSGNVQAKTNSGDYFNGVNRPN